MTILHYKISWFNRNNSRKGSWTKKHTTEVIENLGYEVHSASRKSFISTVYLSGTREEILKSRTEITRRLKAVHRLVPVKFEEVKD